MQTCEGANNKKFQLPGGKAHYPPSLSFTVTHMRIAVDPNLQEGTINCDQLLEITALQDTENLELDAVEISISLISDDNKQRLDYSTFDDKLFIKLGRILSEKERM